jgi:hypothetical protein
VRAVPAPQRRRRAVPALRGAASGAAGPAGRRGGRGGDGRPGAAARRAPALLPDVRVQASGPVGALPKL